MTTAITKSLVKATVINEKDDKYYLQYPTGRKYYVKKQNCLIIAEEHEQMRLDLEVENKTLKSEIEILKAENEALKAELEILKAAPVSEEIEVSASEKTPLPEGAISLAIENFDGYQFVRQSDIAFTDHKRGKNWIATVAYNPLGTNGLSRRFWDSAKGEADLRIVRGTLMQGDFVEFGADYISGSGHRDKSRYYYIVLEIRDDALILEEIKGKPGKRATASRNKKFNRQ